MSTIQAKVGEAPVSDELALVQAAKEGDVAAFEELVRRYDRNVFRIAQHITQNREDAEDVVQDANLRAYRGVRTPLKAQLWRVAFREDLHRSWASRA